MSGYIIEEPNECPIFYDIVHNTNIYAYWLMYSDKQKKRFKAVLFQLLFTWNSVYKTFKFIKESTNMTIIESDKLMKSIYKMFIIEHKYKTEFYNSEKIRLRKNHNYISKKINKIRFKKNKI